MVQGDLHVTDVIARVVKDIAFIALGVNSESRWPPRRLCKTATKGVEANVPIMEPAYVNSLAVLPRRILIWYPT